MTLFAQQILETRTALGMTQTAFAAAIGVSGQSVSNWETGRVTPWPKQQVEILLAVIQLTKNPPQPEPTPQPVARGRIIDRI